MVTLQINVMTPQYCPSSVHYFSPTDKYFLRLQNPLHNKDVYDKYSLCCQASSVELEKTEYLQLFISE